MELINEYTTELHCDNCNQTTPHDLQEYLYDEQIRISTLCHICELIINDREV